MNGPQSPTFGMGNQGFGGDFGAGMMHGTSRTVYLGNIPPDTSAEEILGHVRSGQIESVRLLPDKNCAFISFLDGGAANHFHSDAILKKLSIRGQDIKIGWGKPSQVPTSTALAVQQAQASRNVYLGNLPEEITEDELREDLGKFGPIDTIKLVREKNIGFVHFLSIGNAIKAVAQLPQEPKWQAPRRVFYGKDRCAYISKTQQQNAAQYLGIAPGYAHTLNGADRDLISNALAQQSVAAAAVATTAGGATNLGNRTVYLGNIHPETTIEEICNVVRGGLLHHIRYIPDKHICFVTFIDPTSAASFYDLSNLQGLMIHNRRLKIGWGNHSGALPSEIALAVTGGACRNVYVGNLDETWTEERLRQDFSEYGEIELVNTLREKSCAFVNFTNIANAIKAIEAVRGKEDYKRFKVNFGKDRCGNAPRQNTLQQQQQQQQQQFQQSSQPMTMNGSHESISQSPISSAQLPNGTSSPSHPAISPPAPASTASASVNGTSTQSQPTSTQPTTTPQIGPTASAVLNAGSQNPLTMYLNQIATTQFDPNTQDQRHSSVPTDPYSVAALQQQQQSVLAAQQAAIYGAPVPGHTPSASVNGIANDLLNGSIIEGYHSSNHAPSHSFADSSYSGMNGVPGSSASLVNGLLAPARTQPHARAVSLPAFAPDNAFNGQNPQQPQNGMQQGYTNGVAGGQSQGQNAGGMQNGMLGSGLGGHRQQQSSFGGFGGFSQSGLGGFGAGERLGGWGEES